MITKPLYVYSGENGKIITLVKLPMDYEEMVRIIADDNKQITNGEITATVIDVKTEDVEKWTEIDLPAPEYKETEAAEDAGETV